MIIQLSLSQNTLRNLCSVNPNTSHAIEWIIRTYATDGFPSPYIVNDRSPKQVINVNLSPYSLGILQSFDSFGLNLSQATELLVKEYITSLRATESPEQPPEPRSKRTVPKAKRERSTYPVKEPFVRSQQHGPLVKKAKIKPTKR